MGVVSLQTRWYHAVAPIHPQRKDIPIHSSCGVLPTKPNLPSNMKRCIFIVGATPAEIYVHRSLSARRSGGQQFTKTVQMSSPSTTKVGTDTK